jgi:hypothetical protein
MIPPREIWGLVIKRMPYSEAGVCKLPGRVLRWGTIHDYLSLIMAHKKRWQAKRYQIKDQVPPSDECPAWVDQVCCAKCGTIYYVPDIKNYPGGNLCYQCKPIGGSSKNDKPKQQPKIDYRKLINRINRMMTVASKDDMVRLIALKKQYEEKV